jgi:protein-disulfide isomerase
LIRSTLRFAGASLVMMAALFMFASRAGAQQQIPAAPSPAVSAPTPSEAPVFPKPDAANFTASSPTKEEVNGFLQASWGYDDSRIWQVQAILKTQVDGVSKVVIYVGDKTGKQRPSAISFFTLPDGKHLIAGDDLLAFSDHPFAIARDTLEQRADGPYRNAADKQLELVEFADFQCPHCKEAQANIDKLVADFPKARIVFQYFPLASIHPEAVRAADYGVCVAKQGGSNDFFLFASAVFDGQDGMATSDGATLTLNSAVAKAGLDPVKVAACAAAPETEANVDASVKLAKDLGLIEVPTLMVNGRPVPATIPYETLKKIIEYQAKLDGITL